ncbi:conjugal transfer/type IV secretion protein DotA/TraY [Neorhizobium huautlense]|uniref:Conjugal transfer/type IV secretion protein DotA/TraY n=1 Tax=Neorhizobium huautlense TaxID=67774 RepID=A0ABT9PUB2_9HYPH|nr:DotA/TraY family protein [Neorhizobium huautlense]MDP9837708.1 conjugal transfer/type IV secretion protein DotA/TraY [Neorhizobium huautlense]
MIDLFAEPSSTNLAWKLVTAVLPSDATSAWGRTLQVFTSTLFAFCSALIAYNILSGIVQSAYTGKTLGDRWHQIWTPLRIIVGAGLLVPLPSTGFSPAHYLLRDAVARGGINLADASWGVFVTTVASGETTILPVSSSGSTVAMSILRHEICAAVYNTAGETWGWQVPLPEPAGSVSGLGIPGYAQKITWSYGPTCGHLSYTLPDDRAAFSASRSEAVAEMISAYRKDAQKYAKLAAQTSGLSSAEAVTKAISGKVLSSTIVQDIRARGATFDTKVSEAAKVEAAKVEATSRSKLIENATQEGFLSAGTYFRALGQISALTTTLANEMPEDVAPRTDGDFGQALDRAFSVLRQQVSGENDRANLSANDFAAAGDEGSTFLVKLLAPISRGLAEWGASSSAGPGDAMSNLISSGHAMLSIAWTAIAAGATLMVASSNWFSSAVGAGGAADFLLGWGNWIIGGLIFIGSLRAYVIPILPFLFVLAAGIALVAALLEAMIALPLWCLKWMRMEGGEDFAGEGVRMGLMLTVNVFLRPSLAILAYCGSYPVFDIVLRTMDSMWATAFLAQTGGAVVGLIGFLIMSIIQLYLTWYVDLKLFGQSWALPDRVLGWLGLPGTAGESSIASGAIGGMLSLAGRGILPKTGMAMLTKGGKPK